MTRRKGIGSEAGERINPKRDELPLNPAAGTAPPNRSGTVVEEAMETGGMEGSTVCDEATALSIHEDVTVAGPKDATEVIADGGGSDPSGQDNPNGKAK